MEYVGNVYRPPGEWRSFILQATVGCSHNACTFCGMYKDKRFYIKDMDEIIGDIRETAAMYNKFEKIFIADGDAIIMPTEDLLRILWELKKWFRDCRLISLYAGPKSTLSKSVEELKALHAAGLGRAYLGIESGLDSVLKTTHKGVDSATMLQAGLRLREAGIDLWGIILIGLAGQEQSLPHIRATAALLNQMQPNHLSSMNYTPVAGTPLGRDVEQGRFQVLTAAQSLMETRELITQLQVPKLHFTSDHASNYLPLKGTLPDERQYLCQLIDQALSGQRQIRAESMRGL